MTLRSSFVVCAVALAAALTLPHPAHADVDVLLKTGDAAPDGRILNSFANPGASGPTTAAFLGGTSAIITKIGGSFATVAASGDPLPAPLTGTFNAFFDPVINDNGNVAFRANTNSNDASSGLFFCCDAGAIVPIYLFGGTMGQSVSVRNPPDMNNNDDVVFEVGTTDLVVWEHATQTLLPVASGGMPAPGGGTFSRFGDRPVINDFGRVAFEGEVSSGPEGIFSSAFPYGAIDACALEGAASPIAGGTYKPFATSAAVSINSFGYVAFTSAIAIPGPDTSGVFACDPTTPGSITVAKEGDLVGAAPLTAVDDEYVGIDDAFRVAFEGTASGRKLVLANGGPLTVLTTLSSPSEFAPRLTNAGRVIWRQSGRIERFDGAKTTVVSGADLTPIGLGTLPREPSINGLDDMVFRGSQFVLYLTDHGTTTRIAGPGDPSPVTGTLGSIGALAYRGRSLAFTTSDAGGSLIAFKKSSGAIIAGVHAGDPAPGGGTFDVNGLLFDVRGSRLLFQSTIDSAPPDGLFRMNTQTRQVDSLAKVGDAAPGGGAFASFIALQAAGNDAVFAAYVDPSTRGVFLSGRNGPIQIIREGDVLPDTGGGTLFNLGPVVASGKRIAFTGTVSGGTVSDGLFVWDHGRLTRFASSGDSAGAAGTFGSAFNDDIESGVPSIVTMGSSPAFVADLTGGPASQGLFFARAPGSFTTVALFGDPTSIGGFVGFMDLDSLTRIGTNVVLDMSIGGAGVSSALVRARP